MNKRTFLKTASLGSIGGIMATNAFSMKFFNTIPLSGEFELPPLPYAYDALEPYIDAQTMEIHHDKHHAGYTSKFNAAIKEANLQGKPIMEIFANVSAFPLGVRNNGGGFYNHSLFWKVMSPNGGNEPKGQLASAINENFGSFEKFKDEFSKAATNVFGSGWAWLVKTDNKLVITNTSNQDNPLMDIALVKGNPLLLIDVWEHAYYLKYQNNRANYIQNFWNIVNWDYVSERYLGKQD